MGQIAASYDLMPGSTEVDLQKVIDTLPSIIPAGVKLLETSIKPIAFGLEKVVAGFLINDDEDDIGSKLEEGLRSIDGIENIECVTSTNL
jgi:elongation factor 1-beta